MGPAEVRGGLDGFARDGIVREVLGETVGHDRIRDRGRVDPHALQHVRRVRDEARAGDSFTGGASDRRAVAKLRLRAVPLASADVCKERRDVRDGLRARVAVLARHGRADRQPERLRRRSVVGAEAFLPLGAPEDQVDGRNVLDGAAVEQQVLIRGRVRDGDRGGGLVRRGRGRAGSRPEERLHAADRNGPSGGKTARGNGG